MLQSKSTHLRNVVRAALLVALCVAIGYLFLLIPNFEFITASIFISGFLLGPRYGFIIGAMAEMIFSLFNPYGAPSLPLLLAQVASMAVTGLVGGWLAGAGWRKCPLWLQMILFALVGFLLTLLFDALTTLSFAVLMAAGDVRKIWLTFISGMGFYLVHLLVNTLSFALLVPVLLKRLTRLYEKPA
jgi:energy-coupling factor transport system substrate-specific component